MIRAGGTLLAAALIAAAPRPAPAKEIDCAALLAHVKTLTSLIERAELLETAVQKCPRDGAIACERAFALERLRRYPEALVAYRTAAELDPSNAKAHVGVADTLMQVGDTPGAVAAYERGLALDPKNDRARKALELARIKARAQRGDEISSEEFSRVMTQAEVKGGAVGSAEGPMVRMQILFRPGAARLDDAAVGKLKVVAEAMRSPALAGARLEITGHTDDDGGSEANLALSKARAEAVRDLLVARFKLPAERLTAAGFGAIRPIVPNSTPENRRLNRRVEFRLLK